MNFNKLKVLLPLAILAVPLASCGPTSADSSSGSSNQSSSSSTSEIDPDEELLSSLNAVLSELEQAPSTMRDAVSYLMGKGLDVASMTPTESGKILLWNQKTNEFVLSGDASASPALWAIASTEEQLNEYKASYSVYLSSGFTTTQTSIDVENGLDEGGFAGFETINLVTDQKAGIILFTNGGSIDINAAKATVDHYGTASSLAIEDATYNEHGTVEYIDITNGSLSIKEGASVTEIYISDAANPSSLSIASKIDVDVYAPSGRGSEFSSCVTGATVKDKGALTISGIDGFGSVRHPYIVEGTEDMAAILATKCDGANAKLSADLTYGSLENPEADTGFIVVSQGQSLTLDLNGHAITGSLVTNSASYARAHVILNQGNLSLINSSESMGQIADLGESAYWCTRTIKNTDNGSLYLEGVKVTSTKSVGLLNLGTCVLRDCTVESLDTTTGGGGWDNSTSAIENRTNGKMEIYGGHYESKTRAALFCDANPAGSLDVYGGEFYGNSTYGAINGSSQEVVHLHGGEFNSDITDYVDQASCFVTEAEGMYSVVERHEATEVVVETEQDIVDAIASATDLDPVKMVVEGSVSLNSAIAIPMGSSLVVEGTLDLGSEAYISNISNLVVEDGATVTGVPQENEQGLYEVHDAMDFQWLGFLLDETKAADVEIEDDIVFPAGSTFQTINVMTGKVNGNGHSIKNLTLSSSSSVIGVFQYLIDTDVTDLEFEGLTLNSATGYTGGVVGMLQGDSKFENVTVSGTINVSGASYGVAAFVGSINNGEGDGKEEFVNCVSNLTINAENAYNVGTIYGTSEGSLADIGIYNCANNGAIAAKGSVGIAFGWGSLASGSHLEIIGFKNNGTVTANGKVVTSYLGAASGGSIYDASHADGSKYRAVKDEQGNWTYESIEL